MPSRPTMHRVGLLGVVSAVAGILLAGMLLPIVGGVGLLARTGANDFESLPAELAEPPLPQVSRIVAADGSTLATFYYEDRIAVSLSQVPDVMQKAIIAIEDVRFYEHHGVDLKASLRALLHNGSAGTVRQGGSTLTQQYVKNVLIENAQTKAGKAAAHADTLARKAREARLALALEQRLTKAQILERYLNIAYFGDGAYGVGTAAQHYFGERVNALTLSQSALLAGLVQSPEAYDPALHPQAGRQRRDIVLDQMLKYHFITRPQHDAAIAAPVVLHLHRQGNGCETSSAAYFCDYVQHVIENSPAFGATEPDRIKLLLRGGLTIRTTLQPKVQQAADRAMHKYVYARDPSGVAGAEAVVEPGTGKVLAISVSTPYGNDRRAGQNSIDYAVDQRDGGGQGFPFGSTFKMFVLAAAMKEGIPLSTAIYAPSHISVSGYSTCSGEWPGVYSLGNAGDSESGRFNLITGTWFSVNTFYAQLEQRTGLCEPVKLAESMGVRPATGGHINQYPSFVLGAANTFSPLDVAEAYATMAAHGNYCPPVAITRVSDRTGHVYPLPPNNCEQVVAPGLADTLTSILNGVLTKPGATAAGVGEPGRPAAAKTGTADNNVGSNFAGYVPQMAAAVWVGDPRRPTQRSLNGLRIGGRQYGEVFGATIAGPIWHDTLQAALAGVPVVPLPRPDPSYVAGITSPVPDVTGLQPSDAITALKQAGFHPVVSPYPIDSLLPVGTVAQTTPPGGGAAAPGSTVTIYLSNGRPPPPSSSSSSASSSSTSATAPPGGGGQTTTSSSSASSPTPSCTPRGHGPARC